MPNVLISCGDCWCSAEVIARNTGRAVLPVFAELIRRHPHTPQGHEERGLLEGMDEQVRLDIGWKMTGWPVRYDLDRRPDGTPWWQLPKPTPPVFRFEDRRRRVAIFKDTDG